MKPISYYGGAKLGSEGIISSFAYMNDMSVLVFRFPNVIGPRLTHGVIFDFVKRLKADPSHLKILGDGRQEQAVPSMCWIWWMPSCDQGCSQGCNAI